MAVLAGLYLPFAVLSSISLILAINNPAALFWLAPALFLACNILDALSTYALLKKFGLENFYKKEQNVTLKHLVMRHGPQKGFIYSFFYYKILASLFKLIIFLGLVIYLTALALDEPFHIAFFPLVGILAYGFMYLLAAFNNLLVLIFYRPQS